MILPVLAFGQLDRIRNRGGVYFARYDAVDVLNGAAPYVRRNEQTARLTVVHVHPAGTEPPEALAAQLRLIDRIYPTLRIDFVSLEGTFGPELIASLAERLDGPRSAMFIGSPSHHFPHRIEALGTVRVIL